MGVSNTGNVELYRTPDQPLAGGRHVAVLAISRPSGEKNSTVQYNVLSARSITPITRCTALILAIAQAIGRRAWHLSSPNSGGSLAALGTAHMTRQPKSGPSDRPSVGLGNTTSWAPPARLDHQLLGLVSVASVSRRQAGYYGSSKRLHCFSLSLFSNGPSALRDAAALDDVGATTPRVWV